MVDIDAAATFLAPLRIVICVDIEDEGGQLHLCFSLRFGFIEELTVK